jgi:hypothetical protein
MDCVGPVREPALRRKRMVVYAVHIVAKYTTYDLPGINGFEEEHTNITSHDVILCISKGLAQQVAVRFLRQKYGEKCAHLSDSDLLKKPDLGFVKITFGKQKVLTHL